MGEAVVVSIEEEAAGMASTQLLCETCGLDRTWSVRTCRVCESLARNVALEEEVKELKVQLREARQELGENVALKEEVKELKVQLGDVRQQLVEHRGEVSVRSRVRSGAGESSRGPGEGGWRVVGKGRNGRVSPTSREVECSNRYSLLATQEEEIVIEVGPGEGVRTPKARVVRDREGRRERKDRDRKERSQEVLVLGDSRIRYLDRTFCEADRRNRMTCCLPGAGVQDVVERFRRVVKGTGKEALVVVHVGVNDVGRVGSEELLGRYKELLREIRESRRRCIVSGVLPRQKVGGQWLSHALGLNDRLRKLCEESGVGFLDEWDRFYGRHELYAMDGVHFSRKGVQELSECLERAVRLYSQGN